MKKRLEKIILVITLVFVIGIKGVGAETVSIYATGSISDAGISYGGYTISGYESYAMSGGAEAYCLDPMLKFASGSYEVVASTETALAEGDTLTAAYLTGMGAIVSQGGSYLATSFAVRTFSIGTFGQTNVTVFKTTNSINQAYALMSGFINLARDWNSSGGDAVNTVVSAVSSSSQYRPAYVSGATGYNSATTFGGTSSVLSEAQSLYMVGMEAAAAVINGTTTSTGTATVSGSVTSYSSSESAVYMQIEANNFSSDGFITGLSVSESNCASNGFSNLNLTVKNKSGNYVSVSSTDNLLNYAVNGKIYIKLTYTNAQSTSCSNGNSSKCSFTVSYKYYSSNMANYVAYLLKKNASGYQTFVAYKAVTGNKTGTCTIADAANCATDQEITGSLSCSNNSACSTTVELPVCTDDDADAVAVVTAPTDIKKCILDNVDDAGNSYELSTSNGGVSNDYCSIYCKEDYTQIQLNGIIENVVCGGYFQLSASVTGTKTCYTGGDGTKYGDGSINYDKYIEDIKGVQNEYINAMNSYNQAVAMIAAADSADYDTSTHTCGSDNCGVQNHISVSWSYTAYSLNWNESTGNGTVSSGTESGNAEWYDSCYCDSTVVETYNTKTKKTEKETVEYCGACDDNAQSSLESFKSAAESQKASAESTLNSLPSKYKRIINNYNLCTTGWSNTFLFEQQIKYEYNEYHGSTSYSPYYDLITNQEDTYLTGTGETTLSDTTTICYNGSTADNEYNCQGSSTTMSGIASTSGGTDEYGYSSTYSSVFSSKTYVTCSVSGGCTTDTRQVSSATFIKKEVTKTEDYETPSIFCQVEATGDIVLCTSSYDSTKVQLEVLENSLPISSAATGAGIFKLILEDFGEFYDTVNKVGRIFDVDGDYESISIAGASGSLVNYVGTEGSFEDGTYTCYYESPCTPDNGDCPNCDIVCVGDSCNWEYKECPECIVTCINCLFNQGELAVSMKTISTTNFSSVNRTYGYNWVTTSTLSTLNLSNANLSVGDMLITSEKADQTISEIEEDNETIYDSTSSTSYAKTSGDDSSLGFSIKLTSAVITAIQEYNDEHEDEGGYANDSLTCYDAEIGGVTYENLFCYSELIDELVDDYDSLVTVSDSRCNKNDNSCNRKNSQSSGYWTLWDGFEFYADEVINGSAIGGPSWK